MLKKTTACFLILILFLSCVIPAGAAAYKTLKKGSRGQAVESGPDPARQRKHAERRRAARGRGAHRRDRFP